MSYFLDKNKNKQIVEMCKNKINEQKKQTKKNFNISREKMMKSTLLPNLAKLKKNKNLNFQKFEIKKLKKSNDSFFKQQKIVKNSISKIQTPKNNVKLKKSLKTEYTKESTHNSLPKVSEGEEDDGDGEVICVDRSKRGMMKNGSRSLSTGNLSHDNGSKKNQVNKLYKKSETLKRSVAVKQLKIISNEEILYENPIYDDDDDDDNNDDNDEDDCDIDEDQDEGEEEQYLGEHKAFSQSNTNFKNKYFTVTESDKTTDQNLASMSMTRSNKQQEIHSHLNSKSLNVSSRLKISNDNINISFHDPYSPNEQMSYSQAIQPHDYMNKIDAKKNNSLMNKHDHGYKTGAPGSSENFESLKNSKKNTILRKNISLMNSKERKFDKHIKTKEFKLVHHKYREEHFNDLFSKNIRKKNITEEVPLENDSREEHNRIIIKQNPKLSELKFLTDPLIKNTKHIIKRPKQSYNHPNHQISNQQPTHLIPFKKKPIKISIQKEKSSQKHIEHKPQLPSHEEFNEINQNNLKKKKNIKNKQKKNINISSNPNMKFSTRLNENFESFQTKMQIMRNNFDNKNSEMKKTWIKNTVGDKDLKNIVGSKDLLTASSKLKPTNSRKKLLNKKIVNVLQNKIKQFGSKNHFKKTKKSKNIENKNDKINLTGDQITQKEDTQIMETKSKDYMMSQNKMSKTKSSARLLFFGRINQTTVNKKRDDRNEKFLRLKQMTDGSQKIDREKIKETEFKVYLPTYTKFDLLGKGSYAEVYLCHHKGTLFSLSFI